MAKKLAVCIVSGFLTSALFLSGCAVRPSVSYSQITAGQPDPDGLTDSYFLQTSTIAISKTGTQKDSAGHDLDVLSVTATPTEYPAFKIGISTKSSWLGTVDTTVNISKIDNTSLVKSIGTQVTDNRASTIKSIGSAIATIIPIAAGFAADGELDASALPFSTKTYTQIEADSADADAGKPIAMVHGVTMTLGPLPPDARPISALPQGTVHDFIYAACRDATIQFTYVQPVAGSKITNKVTTIVKISDPRYFETVALPVKGSIASHSECGVSVTTDPASGVTSGADLVDALATEGKAITDALNAKK